MKRYQKTADFRKPVPSKGAQVVFLSALLVIIFAVTILNSARLRSVLNDSAQSYAQDVASQLASDITARIQSNEDDLLLIADTLLSTAQDENQLQALLDRQADILEFDHFMLLDQDGQEIFNDSGTENLKDFPGIQDSLNNGQASVSYIEGQSLLYSVPVCVDDEIIGTLAGLRTKEKMQALIQPKSFNGHGLTCIINNQGEVIVSPTDLKPFLQLDDIFHEEADSEVSQSIQQMQERLRKGQNGSFDFTAIDGSRLILAYNSLQINDWFLLTLIPEDLISGEASKYILSTFITIAAIILIFLLFLLAMFQFYSGHKKHLEQIAFTDPVTGGQNEAAFQISCERLFSQLQPFSYAVVILNVKGFKLINENFGLEAGNDTLRYLYRVIQRNLHDGESVARCEADNFFLTMNETDKRVIQTRLENLVKDINSFNEGRDTPYYLTILGGIFLVDDPSLDIAIIQDRARTAYQSLLAEHRSGFAFYSSDYTERLKKEQELSDLFDTSLENHDFQVYLQPKVRLKDGSVGGAEALVRWVHPQKGMIFPLDFIPLFERNGKICELDVYMFKEVCKTMERWIQEGKQIVPVSVNLSRQHFRHPHFLETFAQIAKDHHLPNWVIEFELTESIFFSNEQIEMVKHSIRQMHRLGFYCSLDDFGSGFSSLGLLKEFDVDAIKLDRQFFLNISQEKAKNVIACLIELAQKLGVYTVAEGIEEESQLDYLRAVRCDMIQGYVFSKPLPIPDFEQWVERQSAKGE